MEQVQGHLELVQGWDGLRFLGSGTQFRASRRRFLRQVNARNWCEPPSLVRQGRQAQVLLREIGPLPPLDGQLPVGQVQDGVELVWEGT